MNDPFKISGPAVVSFSGGRTSGYMLWRILRAHGGVLPDDVKVVFCNTGKERPETLDFVERCSAEWGAEIVWLEYRRNESQPAWITGRNGQPAIGQHDWAEVNYATASRGGRPFEELLATMEEFRRVAKDRDPVLPNPVQRFCTGELKIRTAGRYLTANGWDLEATTDVIGLRADEPKRLAKLAAKASLKTQVWECGHPVAPLGKAGVTEPDVMDFWSRQSFDLHLAQHEGNCDLCFLKHSGKIDAIMRARPDLADWWIAQELATGQTFRRDRKDYAALLVKSKVADSPSLFDAGEPDELSIACHCTD